MDAASDIPLVRVREVKYIVIESSSPNDLCLQVETYAAAGYQCQGGVCMATAVTKNYRDGGSDVSVSYAQAMVLQPGK